MATRRAPADAGRPLAVPLSALVLAVLLAACARNPVTGRRQMMLITEEQEFAIGQGADQEVRRQHGAYLDSPALRSYVDGVGNALAKQGERPGLVFHFEVLNVPEINAFALPGGFVYVTRGILERLSTEDELAMVMGHEIAHVTARHGASRISAMYALQYGSLLGAIISPRTFGNYNDLIGLALQVGLSKYSRDQESQADALGVDYSHRCGYRPQSAVNVLQILQWLEGKEPGALERWFLSHPPAAERIADVESRMKEIEASDPAALRRQAAREAYLRRIDGLIVGLYNGSEMVLKDRYHNKELAVSLHVPPGWEVNLDPNGALVAMHREEKEFVFLEAEPMHTAATAAGVEEEFDKTLKRRGWKRTGGREGSAGGAVARLATYEGATSKGEPIGVLKTFLVHGKHRWTVTAVGERQAFAGRLPDYESWALGIAFLDEEESAALQPPRLKVLPAPAGATWRSLAGEHLGEAEAAERLAFYNGLRPSEAIPAGTLIKLPPSLAVRP
ncbi:MAG TPA: M48 family metalloprotease [Candidatus Polarisedimenticolia bacterium]|nr:M48 family metalloprotease [Candidatus Polarisedimenticolia bacterium]